MPIAPLSIAVYNSEPICAMSRRSASSSHGDANSQAGSTNIGSSPGWSSAASVYCQRWAAVAMSDRNTAAIVGVATFSDPSCRPSNVNEPVCRTVICTSESGRSACRSASTVITDSLTLSVMGPKVPRAGSGTANEGPAPS